MQLIETKTLGTAQSSIVFSDIPQTFTDLYALVSVRSSRASAEDGLYVRPNGTDGTSRRLYGDGSTRYSDAPSFILMNINAASNTSDTFGNAGFYIPNYTASQNKSVSGDGVQENNATFGVQMILAGLWSNTAAITSLTFTGQNGNLIAGSTVSLYGIGGAGDSGGPKATGGNFQLIDGYWLHTFTSSGTFTPKESLTDVEYLIVAGGGGGGVGGGGAGGYRSFTGASLSSGTAYTVTVGGGGATLTKGSNSSFNSNSSTGGGRGGATGNPAGSGGSGGGNYNFFAGSGNEGGYTPVEGYAGSGASDAGGGGGASAAGSGSNGGAGAASSITGSAVTRAGGGGGYNGTGGAGGGGNGSYNTPGAGGTNTGGGGGGAYNVGGAAGGSGIVIVRYAA